MILELCALLLLSTANYRELKTVRSGKPWNPRNMTSVARLVLHNEEIGDLYMSPYFGVLNCQSI
jgi:hypothetical protein